MKSINIIIYRKQAYLPLQGRHSDGFWIDMEPIIVTDITMKALVTAIQELLQIEQPQLDRGSFHGNPEDLVLKATGARSWYELTRYGESYGITWRDKFIRVMMYYKDEKGRWIGDDAKSRKLPVDTSLEDIIELILKDYSERT